MTNRRANVTGERHLLAALKEPSLLPLVRISLTAALIVLSMWFFARIETLSIRPNPFAYERPIFDRYHVARTFALMLCGLGLVWMAVPAFPNRAQLLKSRISLIWLNLCVAVAAAALVPWDIRLFNYLALEDGPVETPTALLLLGACACFGFTSWRLVKTLSVNKLIFILCLSISVAFFVLGMEEISWMQRVIGFNTPHALAQSNWQHEANLHNTHTFVIECLYYTLSAIVLVLAPLLKASLTAWAPFEKLTIFIPGYEVALIAAPAFMFNFAHWDVLPVQLAFWMTCAAVSAIALQQRRSSASALCLLLLVGLCIGQVLILWGGDRASALPDSTEYQELFISLGYLCFSIGACRRILFAQGKLMRPEDAVAAIAMSGRHWCR